MSRSIAFAKSRLAHKYLKSYRVWRSAGKPVRLARSLALFGICGGAASNLLAQNHFRKMRRYWG